MATIKEMAEDIGKEVNIRIGALTIAVTVQDVKNSYGKTRWLVTPISGAGQIWVETIYEV